MALLPILQFPDLRLKTLAKPIEQFDHHLETLIKNMLETMYETQGVGLAATQVDVHQQLIVIDISTDQSSPLHLINPNITEREGSMDSHEGCLSFPGVYATVKRAKKISVEYFDQSGKTHTIQADGLLGICIQHEMDHLKGITFYDHLSPLKQTLLRAKLQKARRQSL